MSTHPPTGRLTRFSARFDDVLMCAPAAAAAAQPPTDCADADALLRAIPGLCPAGAAAAPGFASASHTLAALPAARAQQQAWVNHQLLALDGTLQMLQLGGPLRQRLHRLNIKLQELSRSGPPAAGLPWDCGWLNTTAAAQSQAARYFPRRPTLILTWQLPTSTLQPIAAALQARQAEFGHPVRLWVLSTPASA